MISDKPLDQITQADIDALIANGVTERRTIEYKLTLPGMSDAQKKEFLADVSSLANAGGGDLAFGIEEQSGVPIAALGLAEFDADTIKLRFEQLMRDGLDPRLHGVQMHAVPGFAQGPVFILRIPRSWSGPHRVTLAGSSRFYSRAGVGKFDMNTADLRNAFDSIGSIPKRIRDWRDERLGRIVSNDGPYRLVNGAMLVLHLVPFDSLASPYRFTPAEMQQFRGNLSPLGTGAYNNRINVDGLLTIGYEDSDRGTAKAYAQLFRSGAVETVNATFVREQDNGAKVFGGAWIEKSFIEDTIAYLKILRTLGVMLPAAWTVSILAAKGAYIAGYNYLSADEIRPIDRNLISTPEILIEDYDIDMPRLLRPAFDAIWNACGHRQSPSYDVNGDWKPRQ